MSSLRRVKGGIRRVCYLDVMLSKDLFDGRGEREGWKGKDTLRAYSRVCLLKFAWD